MGGFCGTGDTAVRASQGSKSTPRLQAHATARALTSNHQQEPPDGIVGPAGRDADEVEGRVRYGRQLFGSPLDRLRQAQDGRDQLLPCHWLSTSTPDGHLGDEDVQHHSLVGARRLDLEVGLQ